MHPILAKVQEFLHNTNDGKANIPSELLEQFQQDALRALRRQFALSDGHKFTLRMSNVGRPLCQLQLEKMGVEQEVEGYNAPMRNCFGDIIEAMVVPILKSAGVKVHSCFGECSLDIGGINLKGTYDIIAEGKNSEWALYDIKSVSSYAFNHKFNVEGGFYAIDEDDSFGYVSQGYLYSTAMGLPFGGWIAVNKETGEWAVCEPPANDTDARKRSLEIAERNILSCNNGLEFRKLFADEPEYFRRKPTGNRVLHNTCSYCAFQRHCWPTLQILPNVNSDAMNPKLTFYTHLEKKNENI